MIPNPMTNYLLFLYALCDHYTLAQSLWRRIALGAIDPSM
jgi:hypothetical protein